MTIEQSGIQNKINVGENVTLRGRIRGDNNLVEIASSEHPSIITISLNGSNNNISIGHMLCARNLQINIGTHVEASQTNLKLGDGFSIETNSKFLLHTSGNRLTIGNDCMFSANITIRCGESPHLIFDLKTGDYLDCSEGVSIGNHVWVSENSYFTKSAQIADECIVGANSVVTKKFIQQNAAIAGNPAKLVRTGVKWLRNWGALKKDSIFKEKHDNFHAAFKSPK